MKNKKVLLFAGTTEGRKLAEFLADRGVTVYACVATEYGESLIRKCENLTTRAERMDAEQMCELMKSYCPDYVVDATHPYARVVTENIRIACHEIKIEYLRLVRESSLVAHGVCLESTEEVVNYLEDTTGNILLTTGSKELDSYVWLTDFRERVYARVLSTPEVIEKCAKLGLSGRHLICMQGPFSVEMNRAMLREYNIKYLVTKESGATGGFPEKEEAAESMGVRLVVIGRPVHEQGFSYVELVRYLQKEIGFEGKWNVKIVGIGPGNPKQFSIEVAESCENADLLIGAPRMLNAVKNGEAERYASYKPEEINAYIREHPECEQVTILMSGDTGFFSGAKKMKSGLKGNMEISILPGISSISYFAAKLGVPYDDAKLMSLHGRDDNLISALREYKKIFFLVNNNEHIRNLMNELEYFGFGDLDVSVGTRLSYDDEKIVSGKVRELKTYEGENLAVIYIENEMYGNKIVSHGLPDEAFIREAVPMTKEEIRSISLSKLRLHKNSVLCDVGAGTGSVTVEAALLVQSGMVYAVESNEEAVKLIRKNARRNGVGNIHVIHGTAPEAMEEIPYADAFFIGGSKGKLKDILSVAATKNPHARIVINAITLETLSDVIGCIKEFSVEEEEMIQVSVAKSKMIGNYHMMTAQNPIWIISFVLNEDADS